MEQSTQEIGQMGRQMGKALNNCPMAQCMTVIGRMGSFLKEGVLTLTIRSMMGSGRMGNLVEEE